MNDMVCNYCFPTIYKLYYRNWFHSSDRKSFVYVSSWQLTRNTKYNWRHRIRHSQYFYCNCTICAFVLIVWRLVTPGCRSRNWKYWMVARVPVVWLLLINGVAGLVQLDTGAYSPHPHHFFKLLHTFASWFHLIPKVSKPSLIRVAQFANITACTISTQTTIDVLRMAFATTNGIKITTQ